MSPQIALEGLLAPGCPCVPLPLFLIPFIVLFGEKRLHLSPRQVILILDSRYYSQVRIVGTVEVKSQGSKDLARQGKAGSFPLRVTEAPCTARGVGPPLMLPSCQLLHHIPLLLPALTTASVTVFVMFMHF